MEVKPALALPEGLKVTEIEMIDEVLTITAVSTQITPCCPLCGTPAARVHSRYTPPGCGSAMRWATGAPVPARAEILL